MPGERRKRLNGNKNRDHASSNTQKRPSTKKRKTESTSVKMIPPSANIMSEESNTLAFHNPGTSKLPYHRLHTITFHISCKGTNYLKNHLLVVNYVTGPNMMQPVHNISAVPSTLVHSQPSGPPPASQPMQPVGPMMQQRPDCRLAPAIVPPASTQPNTGVAYPSCMVGNGNHTGHNVEQPDPLNYEPYIWSF